MEFPAQHVEHAITEYSALHAAMKTKHRIKFINYRDFIYFLYQPNGRDCPEWFEFFIDKNTVDVTYPFDSLMSFTFDGKTKQTKEQAECKAKAMIDRYYANPNVKEMFDRIRE